MKVLTGSGSYVAISKLAKGDKVRATNTRTGRTTAQTVAAVWVHHDHDLYDLRVRAGGRETVVRTTRNPPVLGARGDRLFKAASLGLGRNLTTTAAGRRPFRRTEPSKLIWVDVGPHPSPTTSTTSTSRPDQQHSSSTTAGQQMEPGAA
jgi:Pretoxin HINT domain